MRPRSVCVSVCASVPLCVCVSVYLCVCVCEENKENKTKCILDSWRDVSEWMEQDLKKRNGQEKKFTGADLRGGT